MAKNRAEWASGHRQLTRIGLSDGCGGELIPVAVQSGYHRNKFEGHLGNVGLMASDSAGSSRIQLSWSIFVSWACRASSRLFSVCSSRGKRGRLIVQNSILARDGEGDVLTWGVQKDGDKELALVTVTCTNRSLRSEDY